MANDVSLTLPDAAGVYVLRAYSSHVLVVDRTGQSAGIFLQELAERKALMDVALSANDPLRPRVSATLGSFTVMRERQEAQEGQAGRQALLVITQGASSVSLTLLVSLLSMLGTFLEDQISAEQ